MEKQFDSEKYPGIKPAYPLALESYQWATKRFDAIDSRIQTMLGFQMALTLAAPAVFSAINLKLQNCWFLLAICFFVSACAVGTLARLIGTLTIITPKMLYEQWLHFTEPEFQKNIIYFAGQHLETNIRLIAKKQKFLIASTIIFSLEVLCLVLSAVFQY